jgi:predicted ATP-grasp superfamily ATP-dependent carboligase
VSPLLIIGASARSAAMSACRAGFSPWSIDQFGDTDLCRIGPTSVMQRYPCDALKLIRNEMDMPWIYTGGLENAPGLIDRLAARRPLLGNGAAVVRRVRNPTLLKVALVRAGFMMPATSFDSRDVPLDGSWIMKRHRSAGGLHVRRWNTSSAAGGLPRGWYLQQVVKGVNLGVLFVGTKAGARFLGATRSLVEQNVPLMPWLYGGSVGPEPLDVQVEQGFAQLGELLEREFGLVGLFGVDVILVDDRIYVLEVNPRYTASVEVLERACEFNALSMHVAACRGESVANRKPSRSNYVGKRIVYAQSALQVHPQMTEHWLQQNVDPLRPTIADIPQPGTTIAPGEPIATVITSGETMELVQERLSELAVNVI